MFASNIRMADPFEYNGREYNAEIPKKFCCPISREVMEEPTVTNCNHTFEKSVISKWMKKSEICPLDREKITSLQKDQRLINDFEEWKNEHLIEKIEATEMALCILHPKPSDEISTFNAYLRFIKQAKLTSEVAYHIASKVQNSAEIPTLESRFKPEGFQQTACKVFNRIIRKVQQFCIQKIPADQIALCILYPGNLPEDDRWLTLSAYLRMIKKEGLIEEIAVCVADLAKVSAQIPNLEEIPKPEQLDNDSWNFLGRILQKAQKEVSSRLSPRTKVAQQMVDLMKRQDERCERQDEEMRKEREEMRREREAVQKEREEIKNQRDEEKRLQQEQLERMQKPLGWGEYLGAATTVLAPIVIPMVARGVAGIRDTDPDTTFLTESLRVDMNALPSAIRSVSLAYQWRSNGAAGARQVIEQTPAVLMSSVDSAARDWQAVMARDNIRITREANQKLINQVGEVQKTMDDIRKDHKKLEKKNEAGLKKLTEENEKQVDALKKETEAGLKKLTEENKKQVDALKKETDRLKQVNDLNVQNLQGQNKILNEQINQMKKDAEKRNNSWFSFLSK